MRDPSRLDTYTLSKTSFGFRGLFIAMASECEVLIESDCDELAESVVSAVASEAWRIEQKYSRYNADSVVGEINGANGTTVRVDAETSTLLEFAATLFELSEGAFDVTSGVLGRVWRFDGGDKLPTADAVSLLLSKIGWQKRYWTPPYLTLPAGMSLDFGGIGKEYAADKAAGLVRALTAKPVLVNFGGDIIATAPPSTQNHWTIGASLASCTVDSVIALKAGGLATSGDQNRYLLRDGIRYSHILDARTGWPVEDAPSVVTVASPTCVEAGMLASLAALQGKNAEVFLRAQQVPFWVRRE